MELTILGCHSASPRHKALTTAQVLDLRGHLFLIDCGESTQMALRTSSVKFSRIKNIFISHLHGDHFFGIFGLISTFQLLGRETELNIYAPLGAKEVINQVLKVAGSYSSFPINIYELSSKESEIIFEDDKVLVKTIPLDHRIYANGYLFLEKNTTRRLNIETIKEYNIETCYYQNIKNGKDIVLDSGEVIKNDILSFDPLPPHSYAFCSDTIFKEDIIPIIQGVEVLYHEATFLHKDLDLAVKTKHTTALQAGEIASKAKVKTLILGHFSSRYSDFNLLRKEAQTYFQNTLLAQDGKTFRF